MPGNQPGMSFCASRQLLVTLRAIGATYWVMTMAAMDMADDNDRLVQQARDDVEALGRLYDRYAPDIFRYCLHRLFVRQTAEDVTAEVFLQVARQIRTFDGRTAPEFRYWLYAIATGQINAHIRRTRRRKVLLENAVRRQAIRLESSTSIPREPDWADLHAAIATLPARDQAIITLRFFEGLSFEQIAAVLGMRPGAVRMALSRAATKLRVRLDKQSSRT